MTFRVLLLSLSLALLAGFAGCDGFSTPAPKPEKEPVSSSDDTQLSVFAHANIPEVERLIDDLSLQIVDRQSRLDDLASALRLAQRDPAKDAEHRQWSETIARLQGVLREVKELRADTFIRYRKHLLSPDSEAQGMATLLDEATAGAMKQQEAIASILAGAPPLTQSTTTTPVTTTQGQLTAKTNTTAPATTTTHAAPPVTTTNRTTTVRVAVLPLHNQTDVQLAMTQAVFAGKANNRFTVKAPFDQYAHGPRAGLENWIAPLGAAVIRRSDVDGQIVTPTPTAATRGFDAAGSIAHGIDLHATHVLTGRIDAITATKRSENGRDVFDVQVKFRIDLHRVSDRQALASQDYTLSDVILASQFRGFSDTTVAARIVRSMMTMVQSDQAFAQTIRLALQ